MILILWTLFGASLAANNFDPRHAERRSYEDAPPVKYGGPIVYSGDKPPIIHFPPPPAEVSILLIFMTGLKFVRF